MIAQRLILPLAALFLLAGCPKPGPHDSLFRAPPDAARAEPLPGSLPGTLKDLEKALQIPMSDLPDWVERCRIWQLPVPSGMADSTLVNLDCGVHTVLISSFDPRQVQATDAQARAGAQEVLTAALPQAAVRTTLRPGRDGPVEVSVLTEGNAVSALAAGTEVEGRPIGLACGGPGLVRSREAFCNAVVNSMIGVPTPQPGTRDLQLRAVPGTAPPGPTALRELSKTSPDTAAVSHTRERDAARVESTSWFHGDQASAERMHETFDGGGLLDCLAARPRALHLYPDAVVVEISAAPSEAPVLLIAAGPGVVGECVEQHVPALADPLATVQAPLRLRLEVQAERILHSEPASAR